MINLHWFIKLELYDYWTSLRRQHRNSYPFNRSQIVQIHSPHPPHRFWAKRNAQQLLLGRLYLIPTRHPKRHRHDCYSGLKDGGQVTVVTMDVSRPATRIDITLWRSERAAILENVFTQMIDLTQPCCATRVSHCHGKRTLFNAYLTYRCLSAAACVVPATPAVAQGLKRSCRIAKKHWV